MNLGMPVGKPETATAGMKGRRIIHNAGVVDICIRAKTGVVDGPRAFIADHENLGRAGMFEVGALPVGLELPAGLVVIAAAIHPTAYGPFAPTTARAVAAGKCLAVRATGGVHGDAAGGGNRLADHRGL